MKKQIPEQCAFESTIHFYTQLCDFALVLRDISDIKLFTFLHAALIKTSARYFVIAGKEHLHVIFLSCNETLAFQWYYED
jgi:hypothetical protein